MTKPISHMAPTDVQFAWAIVLALRMWGNTRYSHILVNRKGDPLAEKWFAAFIKDWKVARTITPEHRNDVRKYLSTEFRAAIANDKDGSTITLAAKAIAGRRGWTPAKRKGKPGGRTPLSVVSKIAFFLHPDRFAPLDKYGRDGLNKLRGSRRGGGEGYAKFNKYERYLVEFNRFFTAYEETLRERLARPWVKALAKQLGCSATALSTLAFRRKVFDNLLMDIAGRFE